MIGQSNQLITLAIWIIKFASLEVSYAFVYGYGYGHAYVTSENQGIS